MAGWENGTLVVSRAERRHEGRYLCEADNGVGVGLSKVVKLTVNGQYCSINGGKCCFKSDDKIQ